MAIKKSELFICDKLLILFYHSRDTETYGDDFLIYFFSIHSHLIIVMRYQLRSPRYAKQLVISSQVLGGEKNECFVCLIRIRGDVS